MKSPTLLAIGLGLVLAAALVGIYFYQDYGKFLDTPLTVADAGYSFEIEPGDSITTIGRRLEQAGVVRSALYLQIYARLNQLAPRIKTGEYAVRPGMTPRALLDQLVAGRVVQYTLTVIEGWTFQQMRNALAAHPQINHTLTGLSDTEIMTRLGHPEIHPEGRFFPDTYHFPKGTTDLEFLRRAYNTLEQRLQQAWDRRKPGLPLQNADEALILASIIEKETALPSERREVAGVFTRRLQKGMLLQTDPTVIYGLGKDFDGNLRRTDLRRDTPYNTYTRQGLPPTPIALPSADSIAAAVDPAPGDTLYFVAKGDGGHVFSRNLEEHNRQVRRYQLNRP
ncbi:MAG: endolytic transglycosylase MltG [Gammaproteobacteria bacterium]|nr:endolytic transglycosylase MltG [Gammaproteobacteria bacterium]MCP5424466.1 endolytic transglycosylase MltG [Gammaproteobacteria bacterium]MCP5458460.1 endolytic transglycosylase MltG [Gammaproteobacteria bacterium]